MNIIKLYTKCKGYFIDGYKLREIFLLCEKFTNLYTLRLLYIGLENSDGNTVKGLFDFDVMKVIH